MSTAGYVQEGKYQKRHCVTFSLLICVTLTMFFLVAAGLGVFGWLLVTNRDRDFIIESSVSDSGSPHEIIDDPYLTETVHVEEPRNKDDDNSNENYYDIGQDAYKSTTTTTTTQSTTTTPAPSTTPIPETPAPSSPPSVLTERAVPSTTTTLSPSGVSDAELSTLVGLLWDASSSSQFVINRDYILSFQDQTNATETVDRAPKKLFHRMNRDFRGTRIYKKFVRVLRTYSALWEADSPDVTDYVTDVTRFMEVVAATGTWAIVRDYLAAKDLLDEDNDAFLSSVWAQPYTDSEGQQTNGFQRVFAGQPSGDPMIGLNSWVQFYLQEKQTAIDYQGYINRHELGVMKVRFSWEDNPSQVSTFFVGTSPEFDISLYTLCLVVRMDTECNFTLQDSEMTVIARNIADSSVTRMESAFPVLNSN